MEYESKYESEHWQNKTKVSFILGYRWNSSWGYIKKPPNIT